MNTKTLPSFVSPDNSAKNDSRPAITVVVVCYNAVKTIAQCLTSILQMDYPGAWELLVVDNGSNDGTLAWLQQCADDHPAMRFIVNPVRGIAVSRNLGWQQALYEYVAYTDADCTVPENWLTELAHAMQVYSRSLPMLAAVGGSNVPPRNGSPFYQALDLFLNCYLGSHSSVQGRRFSGDQLVPHLPTVNVLYRKCALQSVNGFDVDFFNIGEDRDLAFRLHHAGYRMYYVASATVTHAMRTGFRAWLANTFLYGKGRMWLLRRHPREAGLVFFAPMALVLLFAFFLWTWPLLLAYFVIIIIYSFVLCVTSRQWSSWIRLAGLFAGSHAAYGLGEWYGVFKNRPHFKMGNDKA